MLVRRIKNTGIVGLGLLLMVACSQESDTDSSLSASGSNTVLSSAYPVPPHAKKIPKDVSAHGDSRIDNYYWMRDDTRSDAEIIAHLEAENAYTNEVMAPTQVLQEQLFQEMLARIQKDDSSVPYKKKGYWYYSTFSGEMEYPIYARRAVTAQDSQNAETGGFGQGQSGNGQEEILVNVNELAAGHEYFSFANLSVSQDGQILAYATDTLSRRIYTIEFKDLKTGELLPDKLYGASSSLVWANDNKTLFYIKREAQTLLEYQVFRHTIGSPQSEDVLVYEETDKTFYTDISKSLDESLIFIRHDHTLKSGVSVLDADNPESDPELFQFVEKGHKYQIKKSGNYFYILTNWNARNFRIMRVAQGDGGDRNRWQELVAHQKDTLITGYLVFKDFLVLQEMHRVVPGVRIIPLKNNAKHKKSYAIQFEEEAFATSFEVNANFESDKLRLNYSSLTTPSSVYEYDLLSRSRTVLKQQSIPGKFEAKNYQSERLFVTARDGTQVPVSLVYRKDLFKKDGSNPLYQYGYGSYGANIQPRFRISILPLLDRGFVYAIAHIRGGQSMGRSWYEDGKLFKKKNTFSDFIDVTKGLISMKYADANRTFIKGGSAGGLLIGGVVNMAPDLYTGAIADVPFVDVLTTMLDASIPLTTNEWDEWGDPREPDYYAYMRQYSPYDNVERKDYPALMITTGFHDSQVQYFEPAKWVAKLRELKTDSNLLIFKVDMQAGHGGSSGRFKPYRDKALEYAFVFDLADISK
ncbi:MAG: S9 family peptidase [Pseudomonadales bacterium]|nr:S9 family peptidase [Pseudomonadales bacterium]